MESSCDSDLYSVQTFPPDESDIETQLLAEQENDNKQDIIDNLQKELSICRAQFEQSAAINKKIESVHSKNQKLTEALQNLQSEKEDLVRRLEISIKANEDLESKMNDVKFTSSQQVSRESADKERELAKLKKEYENTVETMSSKIESLEKANENLELNNKMLSNKIDRLLQNSNQHFGFTFSDPDSLIEFLLQPRVVEPTRQEEPVPIIDNNAISIVETKNRIFKQKLKESRYISQKLVKEIQQLKIKLQESEKSKKSVIQSYEKQIEQINEDNSNNISLLNETVNNLNAKIQKLKTDNQNLKSEIKELHAQKINSIQNDTTVSEASIQIEPLDNKKQSHVVINDEFEVLNQRNSELSEKVQLLEKKNEQLQAKLKEEQESKNQLEIQLENQKVELNSLKVVHDEALHEVSTLRESLHNKCQEQPKKKTNDKSMLPKLKIKLDGLKKKIQLLSQQIQELQLQNETERRQRDIIEARSSSTKSELEEAQARIASLTDELSILRQQNDEKPSLTVEDVIPSYAWRFSEFDQELAQRIEKVALNPLLQPVSKLNNVYKVIQKYIQEVVKQKDDSFQNLFDEIQNLKTKVNKFIVDISILLSLNPLTISDFLNCNGSDAICKKLSHLIQEQENSKRKEACFQSFAEFLISTFDNERAFNLNDFCSNNSGFQSYLTNLKNQMVLLSTKLSEKCRKLHALKTVIKDLKKSTTKEITSLKSQLNEQKSISSNLKKDNDMLHEINHKLKSELHSYKKNFSDFQQKTEEKESLLQDEYEQKINNAQSIHCMSEQSLKKQVDLLLKEKENNRSTIDNYESSINHLKTVIDKDQRDIREKEKMIVTLTSERDAVQAQAESKFKQEKEQIIKSYEKAINEIKKQFDNSRTDLERISCDLSASLKKNRSAKNSIVTLKKEKMRLENEIKALYDQVKRERQISEADVNNKIMSAETNFSKKLHDYKTKCENEKKRIFSYVASEFRQFFNPSEIIDEKSFRYLLARIKKEYDKLYYSDTNVRRLVGAAPQQPTEEAVAHLMAC